MEQLLLFMYIVYCGCNVTLTQPIHIFFRTAKFWRPALSKKIFYSEILDCHMEIIVTIRTLNMIDEAYGFDFYILKVSVLEWQTVSL